MSDFQSILSDPNEAFSNHLNKFPFFKGFLWRGLLKIEIVLTFVAEATSDLLDMTNLFHYISVVV